MLTIKLGPLMTAEEAKEHYCPHTMNCSPSDSYKCMGDLCMAWMWLEELRRGMFSHDQEMAMQQELLEAREAGKRIGFCCK